MAITNYRLRSRIDKNVSIYIVLSLGRNKKYETPTGFYINPKDWKENKKNSFKQLGFPKNSKLAEIKNLKNSLTRLSGFIDTEINKAQSIGEIININWLKNQIDICFERIKDDGQSNLLTDYIQYIINNADTKILKGGKVGLSKNRVKGYVTFKGVIENYQKHLKREIKLKEIDVNFDEDFRSWLIKTKGYSINYAGKNFDNLKAVCNDALRKGLEVNDHAIHLQTFAESKDNKEVITLSFDELDQIENYEVKSESLINVRKWLLFGCEIGQRGGDLLSITEDNFRINKIDKEYIDIIQQKTGKQISIAVSSKLRRVLVNGLPYKISIQKFNNYLKDLCELTEINKLINGSAYDSKKKRKVSKLYPKHKLITSHTCRRSFATNYYGEVPTPTLMNITGHSKESLFLTYIGKEEDKDANADLMFEHAEIMEQKRKEQKGKDKNNKKAPMKVVNKKAK